MAKNDNREKTLSALADLDEKISKHERELKTLAYKRQTLFYRTILSEMKVRNLTLKDFFIQMDNIDSNRISEKNTKDISERTDNNKILDIPKENKIE